MGERLSIYANQIGAWESFTLPKEERTPKHRLARTMEEVDELIEAVGAYDGSDKAKANVKKEASDVMVGLLGIMLEVGGDPDAIMTTTIQDILAKYPQREIKKDLDAGVPRSVTMERHKVLWKREKH